VDSTTALRSEERVNEAVKQELKRKYSDMDNVAFVIDAVSRHDRALLGLAAVNALSSSVSGFVPVFMPKLVIDQLTQGGAPSTVLAIITLLSIVLFVSTGIDQTSRNWLNNRFIVVRLRMIAESGIKFMTMDFQNLEDPKVLDLSQKGDRACNNNSDGIEGVMHRLLSLFGGFVVLAGTSTVITMLHPLLLVAIVLLLVINFCASSSARRLDKKIDDDLAKVRRRSNYISRIMSDFAYGKDIRLFGMRDFLLSRYGIEQEQLMEGNRKIERVWFQSKGVLAVTGLAQEVIMYLWLCVQVVYRGMSIGDFTMYSMAIRTFSGALDRIFDDISRIRQQNAVISDFRSFLDYPDWPSGTRSLPGALREEDLCFELENVSFRYPGREEYALRNVSLRIEPGERLAVVGLNGAGKSTFVKLLTRLYRPTEGRILLNGVDVQEHDRREYYRLFSVVFQDIQMFAFTVAENVSMRSYELTDEVRVQESLERAGLGPKIKALPKGLRTPVLKVIDEGGAEFSGGEGQKLALARALYKDGPVVILDEPTAALDAIAEAQLYQQFDGLIGDRTAIYISHRLASTRFCDRVIVFEDGRIIETGTHDELMERGGRYAELFALQAKYYSEEVTTA